MAVALQVVSWKNGKDAALRGHRYGETEAERSLGSLLCSPASLPIAELLS